VKPVSRSREDRELRSLKPTEQVFRDFHQAQGRFYAGGAEEPLRALLSEDVTWHVPGRSAIAGDHEGIEAVIDYFRRRRDFTSATFHVVVRDVLASGDRVVAFAGGEAERYGRRHAWETAGVFLVRDGKIAECRLLPFDQYLFDEIWA
jgi:ketosteroid isomerase-like protein